jgi:hypothetical protein
MIEPHILIEQDGDAELIGIAVDFAETHGLDVKHIILRRESGENDLDRLAVEIVYTEEFVLYDSEIPIKERFRSIRDSRRR